MLDPNYCTTVCIYIFFQYVLDELVPFVEPVIACFGSDVALPWPRAGSITRVDRSRLPPILRATPADLLPTLIPQSAMSRPKC